MILKDLQPLLVLLDFQPKLGHQSDLLPHDLVELLVLVVGIGREVLVQVVLRNCVHDVVSHLVLLISKLKLNCNFQI